MDAFLETFRYLQEEVVTESHGSRAPLGAESEVPSVKFGGAVAGDLIQWESGGALQFETPHRVRWVSEDGAWLAVEGSDTGIPMSQVTVEQAAPPKPPLIPPACIRRGNHANGKRLLGVVPRKGRPGQVSDYQLQGRRRNRAKGD